MRVQWPPRNANTHTYQPQQQQQLLLPLEKTAIDRGSRSDRPRYQSTPTRPEIRRCRMPRRATAADDVTMEIYYYGRKSTLTYDLDFQSQAFYGHDPYHTRNKGHRSTDFKDSVKKTDWRTDTADRFNLLTTTVTVNLISSSWERESI